MSSRDAGPVVVLAGGTGGAKLARGMLEVIPPERLSVIANTGDDIEIHGAHVSPDPDLISFWLADLIDENGWGLRDDTFAAMEGLRALGQDVWFNLGDRDLAIGLDRLRRLRAGERLTEIHRALSATLPARGHVLPMSDQPVRTRVMADGAWSELQEFLIRRRGRGPVQDVEFRGARGAAPTPEVLRAINDAAAILIGPSNPVISIGPILALPGLRQALIDAPAPVVAVSPIVAGKVMKGPTAEFLRWAQVPLSAAGIARWYRGVIDGIVADEPVADLPTLQTDLLMDSPSARRRLAEESVRFCRSLGADASLTGTGTR